MTFEYSGDPATSAKDEVRFLIGDTNDEDQLFQDEELLYLLASSSTREAAVQACGVLAGRYAMLVDKVVGDLQIMYSQRARAYREQAKLIAAGGAGGFNPVPFVSGVSISEKESVEANLDRVPSTFRRGMDDYAQRAPDDRPWVQQA